MYGGQETGHGHRLRNIGLRAGLADALFVTFGGICRHRHDRYVPEPGIRLDRLDQFEPTDVGQLDIHDDQVRIGMPGTVERVGAILNRLRLIAMGPQKIAEQLEVELIVLDNEHLLGHRGSSGTNIAYSTSPRHSIMMKGKQIVADPVAIGLHALAWTLSDQTRAERMLALTGLTTDDLRARAEEPATLAALLGFLEAYEPDLIACAAAIELTPQTLVATRKALES